MIQIVFTQTASWQKSFKCISNIFQGILWELTDLTLYQFRHRKKKKKIFGEGGGLRLKMMIVKDCIRWQWQYFIQEKENEKKKL